MQTTEALTSVPEAAKEGRLRGFIRKVKDKGWWGFITTEDHHDYFWHRSEFPKGHQPKAGELVEFTPVATTSVEEKNPRAIKIEVIG